MIEVKEKNPTGDEFLDYLNREIKNEMIGEIPCVGPLYTQFGYVLIKIRAKYIEGLYQRKRRASDIEDIWN